MAEDNIKIEFTYETPEGWRYSASSFLPVFYDDENDIEVMGRQFNAFLRQAGFVRPGDYMLVEDLTEQEYDALRAYLEELRNGEDTEDDH